MIGDNDTHEPRPPPGVGPHEGRELALMLRGEKPLAFFSEVTRADFDWPDADFAPHVAAGRLIEREFLREETIDGRVDRVRYLYYALPGEEWRIDAAHENRTRTSGSRDDHNARCREMGRLLGYSPDEIEAYIAWADHLRALYPESGWRAPRGGRDGV